MDDLISRQAAIDALHMHLMYRMGTDSNKKRLDDWINNLPSAQPERLTDDDFETIRIHLNAYKEKLCNQQRWEEADEYQRIIDRFMAFASAEPDVPDTNVGDTIYRQDAIDALKMCQRHCIVPDDYYISAEDAEYRINALPSAQQDLTEEDWSLIRQLRSYHNGTYAKVLDKLIASARPERKTGTLVFVRGEEAGNALYMCSACGKGDIHAPEVRVSYCWHCGAQMGEEA